MSSRISLTKMYLSPKLPKTKEQLDFLDSLFPYICKLIPNLYMNNYYTTPHWTFNFQVRKKNTEFLLTYVDIRFPQIMDLSDFFKEHQRPIDWDRTYTAWNSDEEYIVGLDVFKATQYLPVIMNELTRSINPNTESVVMIYPRI